MSLTRKELKHLLEQCPSSVTNVADLSDEEVEDLSRHCRTVLLSFGSNGVSGGLFQDTRTGRLYVALKHSSDLLALMRPW